MQPHNEQKKEYWYINAEKLDKFRYELECPEKDMSVKLPSIGQAKAIVSNFYKGKGGYKGHFYDDARKEHPFLIATFENCESEPAITLASKLTDQEQANLPRRQIIRRVVSSAPIIGVIE